MIKDALMGTVQKSMDMGHFDEDQADGTNPLEKMAEEAIKASTDYVEIRPALPTIYRDFKLFLLGEHDDGALSEM